MDTIVIEHLYGKLYGQSGDFWRIEKAATEKTISIVTTISVLN